MSVRTTTTAAVYTTASTYLATTGAPAMTDSCWHTMATTVWVRRLGLLKSFSSPCDFLFCPSVERKLRCKGGGRGRKGTNCFLKCRTKKGEPLPNCRHMRLESVVLLLTATAWEHWEQCRGRVYLDMQTGRYPNHASLTDILTCLHTFMVKSLVSVGKKCLDAFVMRGVAQSMCFEGQFIHQHLAKTLHLHQSWMSCTQSRVHKCENCKNLLFLFCLIASNV